MRILSNFNTCLIDELMDDAIQKFGTEHVMCIRRDRIYIILKVVLPMMILLTMIVALLMWSMTRTSGEFIDMIRRGVYIISGIGFVWFCIRSIGKIIDYYMDFTIITPMQILAYDQHGIFKRISRSLDLTKLKSVNIEKDGILRSMFNYGSIVFFSEGDVVTDNQNMLGNVKLNYINYPRKVRKKIIHVIKQESD